ncbi:MAG: hypothetical protein P8X69_14565, partial [Maritimibacter sp.]
GGNAACAENTGLKTLALKTYPENTPEHSGCFYCTGRLVILGQDFPCDLLESRGLCRQSFRPLGSIPMASCSIMVTMMARTI